MKFKIFAGKDFSKIEERINNWLEENLDIKIIHVGQSTQFLTEKYPSHTIISIFYEKESLKSLETEDYI